jgi:hypothetical protein
VKTYSYRETTDWDELATDLIYTFPKDTFFKNMRVRLRYAKVWEEGEPVKVLVAEAGEIERTREPGLTQNLVAEAEREPIEAVMVAVPGVEEEMVKEALPVVSVVTCEVEREPKSVEI